ncbi:MAG: glycosyltransferase family A protein [Ferruginibacter sp.]
MITNYNREAFISDAINSVLASEYKNFELIIVDDCSTDNSVGIINEFKKNDDRIQFFINEKNLGQFANRNKAASLAKGTFLKYVDSDDIIYPNTLHDMLQGMLHFPEAALGFCLTHGPCKKPLPYKIEKEEAFQQHFFEGGLLFAGPSGLIIKRDAFEMVGGYEEYGMPSDNHLTLKIASKFAVVAFPRDLFWWRIHPGQVFTKNLTNYDNIFNNYMYTKDIILHYSPMSTRKNSRILRNLEKIFYLNLSRLATIKVKPAWALRLLFKKIGNKY